MKDLVMGSVGYEVRRTSTLPWKLLNYSYLLLDVGRYPIFRPSCIDLLLVV